ncbi:MAG: hypothetical protein ACRD09_02405 [Vicinamibacterales bacterium]
MNEKPAQQLARSIAKYSPEIGALARAALAKMRARLPGAVQLVYDNYNALVIGFGPTERASDAVFSIALYPRWVNLFFLNGAGLHDPQKLLQGTGSRVRRIPLETAAVLDAAPVRALMAQALEGAKPFNRAKPGRIVIKMVAAKQRPRQPGKNALKAKGLAIHSSVIRPVRAEE